MNPYQHLLDEPEDCTDVDPDAVLPGARRHGTDVTALTVGVHRPGVAPYVNRYRDGYTDRSAT